MQPFAAFYAENAEPIFSILALIVAVIAFGIALRSLRRKRLMENVPTAKAMGVFIGLVELKGKARALQETMQSPLADATCVYYRYEIEEKWERTTSDGEGGTETETGWKTVRSEERRPPFELEDDTGAVRIKPAQAEIKADESFSHRCDRDDPLYYAYGPAKAIANSEHERRFTEYVIPADADLYVMGPSQVREDVVEPEIAHEPDAELFLISTKDEKALTRGYALTAGGLFPLAVLAFAAVPWIGFAPGEGATMALQQHLPSILLWGLTGLLIVLSTYAVLVFNGLRKVDRRRRHAHSLIDIELKRRHDLIPRLVACVEAVAEHEQDLQEAISTTRSPRASDDGDVQQASRTADKQTEALDRVMGVAERYPDLKADESFRTLMRTLTRTEKKIALARNYFNDAVTAYNNRIETLPDLLFAPLGGYTEEPLFQSRDFERHPVSVDLKADSEDASTKRSPSASA